VTNVTTYRYGFDDALSSNHFPELMEASYHDSLTPTTTYGFDRRVARVACAGEAGGRRVAGGSPLVWNDPTSRTQTPPRFYRVRLVP
jgi:hypothetical protein